MSIELHPWVPIGTPSPQLEMISFLRRRTGSPLLVALLPLLEGVAVENPENEVLEFEMKLSSVSKRIREVAKTGRFQSEQIGILLTSPVWEN